MSVGVASCGVPLSPHSKHGIMADSCDWSKNVTLLTASDHFIESFPVLCLLYGTQPIMTIMNNSQSRIVVLERVKYAWGVYLTHTRTATTTGGGASAFEATTKHIKCVGVCVRVLKILFARRPRPGPVGSAR